MPNPLSNSAVYGMLQAEGGVFISFLTLRLCDGDYRLAAFVQQLLYWQKRTNDPEGWVVKSAGDWESELMIPGAALARVTKLAKELGLETVLKRSPYHGHAPVTHFRFNMAELAMRLGAVMEQGAISQSRKKDFSDSEKSDLPDSEKSIHTETLAESSAAPMQKLGKPPTPPAGQGDPMQDDSLPDFLTPGQRRLVSRNDTAGSMDGWALVEAFVSVGQPPAQSAEAARTMWSDYRTRQTAAQLARSGVTREDVIALVTSKRQGSGETAYAFRFLVTDMIEWKAAQASAAPSSQPVTYATAPEEQEAPPSQEQLARMRAELEQRRRGQQS